jgi:AcrR family transcriptional regulator
MKSTRSPKPDPFTSSQKKTKPPARPAGRAVRVSRPLSRETIEQAALVLIEQDGLEAFSTRRLGDKLGCQAMSIYHHFPSKAHILDALVDRFLASIPLPSVKQSPSLRLHAIARNWRRAALTYPRLYPYLALHRWNSETGVKFLAEIMQCFYDAGFSDEASARHFRVLCHLVLGATLDEINGYGNGPSSAHPISDSAIKNLYPSVAKASKYFQPNQFERTFEYGLDLFLRGSGLK